MADKPIIFSAPMVRALLDGRKTQTRRVLTHSCDEAPAFVHQGIITALDELDRPYRWPKSHSIGDRLWVREAFITGYDIDDEYGRPTGDKRVWYRATDSNLTWFDPDTETTLDNPPWRTSIHMPRFASRLTLIVSDVRVQRLQEITLGDICAEGLAQSIYDFRQVQRGFDAFADLWNSIHGPGAWDANPWVCAITFTVHRCNIHRCNIDQMEAANG